MTHLIYKYELGPLTRLALPHGAQPLTVGIQGDRLVLWALFDRAARGMTEREFIAVNTDAPFDGPIKAYIGTATSPSGAWHVFEIGEPEGGIIKEIVRPVFTFEED